MLSLGGETQSRLLNIMHNVGCGQEHAKSRWHVLIKHFSFLNTCKKVLGAFGNVMSQKTPNELPQR
jgi:hypothetical protein